MSLEGSYMPNYAPSFVAAFIGCIACATSFTSSAVSKTATAKPVMIGTLGPEMDACNNMAWIFGVKPKGDGFVAVRSAPGIKEKMIDKLLLKQVVYLCDENKSGLWYGIVYQPNDYDGNGDCKFEVPVNKPKPYKGPCRSGWVSKKYIEIIAG
jgi:hypothetical protein